MSAQRMTTEQVLDAIARERHRLDRAVAFLGGGASTVPVTPEGWTAEDVLAHSIHWVSQIAFGLGADEWSARAVAHYRDLPLAKMKAEFTWEHWPRHAADTVRAARGVA
ncbi:MAG TPA: hypothetical protein VGR87_02830 [Candidatus Limnocylindria bacterium]|jgi:hypothetical protein|nr:hypothetical protein [Candidatus Limnocylindria bacterium]